MIRIRSGGGGGGGEGVEAAMMYAMIVKNKVGFDQASYLGFLRFERVARSRNAQTLRYIASPERAPVPVVSQIKQGTSDCPRKGLLDKEGLQSENMTPALLYQP
jgi:hypothetical protein